MRVLLDTNIIIHRENKCPTNYSVGHLFRWLDKLKCEKLVHPLSKKEIGNYIPSDPHESMDFKLDAYEEMQTTAPMATEVSDIAAELDKDNNDVIDSALLNEIFQKRVDILITEDKKLHYKAARLGINHKVFSINAFISFASAENPALVEYKTLAVQKKYFGDIDVRNVFFDSLRETYVGFDEWFARKCNEEAYLCEDNANGILGFLYLKTEYSAENYSDITPPFTPKKRLKVGTFKVDATGFRLGERFIKIIFDNAIERSVDEIYITLFENHPELETLEVLLLRWGFKKYGVKTGTGEIVLTKRMRYYSPTLTAKQNFPNILYNNRKFIMPILPKYHTSLLPDSILRNENESDFLENMPFRYALQKVYISFISNTNASHGDLVIFYRTGEPGNAKHTGVLTSVAIVEDIVSGFSSKEEYLRHVQNRSVFNSDELEGFWNRFREHQLVLKFIFVKNFSKRPILEFLWENNIIAASKGPRPFTQISDNQFEMILREARTDLSRYWS